MRNIREVWDFRLSSADPTIYNLPGENWQVEIHDKGENNEPLATFDTGIPSTPDDNWNDEAIDACYAWLRSVRDEYALPHIEIRKPVVALINECNAEVQAIVDEMSAALAADDIDEADRLKGKKDRVLEELNAKVKVAIEEMNAMIAELEAE